MVWPVRILLAGVVAFVSAGAGTLMLARGEHDRQYRECVEAVQAVLETEFPELDEFYDNPWSHERTAWGWRLARRHSIQLACRIEVGDSTFLCLMVHHVARGLSSNTFVVVDGISNASRHARAKHQSVAEALRRVFQERGMDVPVEMDWN